MKKLFTLFLFLPLTGLFAQTVFWTENFGSGCSRGTLANGFVSTNGTWTVTNTGTNASHSNIWFVSATASGTQANQCANSCMQANVTDRTLHIGNPAFTIMTSSVGADTTSTYLTGAFCGFGVCSTTDKRVESPTINCTNRTNLSVSFLYYEGGETTIDDATLWYYNGTAWSQINGMAKTNNSACPQGVGVWTSLTVALPSDANNNPNVKIGFRWVNDDNGQGVDPSVAIDNITIAELPPTGMYDLFPNLNVYSFGTDIFIQGLSTYKVAGVFDILGKQTTFEKEGNKLSLTAPATGIYMVQLEVEGKIVTRKVMIR
jgi:hypothetical protein